jgi:hypothetical protein
MYVDVQIVLVKCAGHAEGKRELKPEEILLVSYFVSTNKYKSGKLCHSYAYY